MGNPQPKVKNWNEAKFRALHWVRERLYERSVGHALREGATPPSLMQINQTVGLTPLPASLPYEVYEDGLFVSDDACGRAWHLEQTLVQKAIAPVLAQLKPGQLLQLGQFYEEGQRVGGFVSINCQATLSRGERKELDQLAVPLHDALTPFDAQDLLDLIRPLLADGMPAPAYDPDRLLSCQLGDARLVAKPEGICMQNASGSRRYRQYTVRCGAIRRRPNLYQALAGLNSLDRCWITGSFCRADNGLLQGQVVVLAEDGCRSEQTVRAAFAADGWLVESEIAQAHLALMSCLPLMSQFLWQRLAEQRRLYPMTEDEALRLLPVRLVGGVSR